MADEPENDVVEPAGKKRKLLIIIGAFVVVAILAVAAYFLLLSGGSQNSDVPDELADPADISRAASSGSESRPVGDAIYIGMPRPFVFNVPGDERDRLVQIKVQLMVRGTDNEDRAKRHIPLIEGTLLQVFSSMTAEELQTAEGKDKIRELGLERLQQVLREVTGQSIVEEVLFTGFVLQ